MIFVIDTSSALSKLAILDDTGAVHQEIDLPARSPELIDRMRALASASTLTRVAVATGPGSFTGLRVGVSFGLGLAMGLRIPIIPLPSLDLQAARAGVPATAVIEAGRGRVYYRVPGGKPMLGSPDEVPTSHPLVGNVAPVTEAALLAAGHRFAPVDPAGWAKAASRLLETAREVPYGSLKLEYMQSFSASK